MFSKTRLVFDLLMIYWSKYITLKCIVNFINEYIELWPEKLLQIIINARENVCVVWNRGSTFYINGIYFEINLTQLRWIIFCVVQYPMNNIKENKGKNAKSFDVKITNELFRA